MFDCGPEPRAPAGNTDQEAALFANELLYWGRGCTGKLGALRDALTPGAAPPPVDGNVY